MEFLGLLNSAEEEEKSSVSEPLNKKRRTLSTTPESGTGPGAERAAASPRHAPASNSIPTHATATTNQGQQTGLVIPSTTRGEVAFTSNGANVYKIG